MLAFDQCVINVFNIVYLFLLVGYSVVFYQMAEGRQRSRKPTTVSGSNLTCYDHVAT